MKKFIIFAFSVIVFCVPFYGQDLTFLESAEPCENEKVEELKGTLEFKLKNSLIGFGVGSRLQGDLKSAKILLATDITGLSLMTLGCLCIVAADYEYKAVKAFFGEVTKADYWIAGSVFASGAIVFLTGRIFGIILPDKFEINENMDATIIAKDKGVGIDFVVRF